MRLRRVIDAAFAVAALACVVAGFSTAVRGLSPFAGWYREAYAKALASPDPERPAISRAAADAYDKLREDERFLAWWGDRHVPWLARGGYMAVLLTRPINNTLGATLGDLVLEEKDDGVRVTSVVMPRDFGVMLGTDQAAQWTRADGTKVAVKMAHPGRAFTRLSKVPVTLRDYDAMLSDSELKALKAKTRFERGMKLVWLAEPDGRISGQWVLMAREIPQTDLHREFYLMPIESARVLDLW